MNCTRTLNPQSNPQRALAVSSCALGLALLLAGCGTAGRLGSSAGVSPVSFQITGSVHGGQQPVSASTIQLYTVGTTGLKSASTALLTSTVVTDSTGSFNITGKYNCAALPATQVYITASGGNPGSGNNSALTMATALGSCSALSSSTFIQINEATTIAAAYALAPFAADLTHIGASGPNPAGLVGAFANATLLASSSAGAFGGTALAAGTSLPITELNTLADILAACVNTTGPSSGFCTTLFNATGATDTFGAALAIARNPGASAITALYTLASPSAPFQPTFTSAPNDFAVALTSTANAGLATPYGISLDGAGNAWITNEAGNSITEISPSGSNLASATAPGLFGAQGIAVDRLGNVWVANTAGNSVIMFSVTSGAVTGNTVYTAGGIAAPTAIAVNNGGNVWVTNFNGNSVTGLTSAGVPLSGSPFTGSGNIKLPTSIAINSAGTLYVASAPGSVVSLTSAGAYTSSFTDGTIQGPVGVAVDSANRIAATGFSTGSAVGGAVSQFGPDGTPVSGSPATTGVSLTAGVAMDGSSVWVANNIASGGLAQYTDGAPTKLSPAAGFGPLNAPVGVAVDATGSVWTTNSGSNSVSRFIGLGAPVATPLATGAGPLL